MISTVDRKRPGDHGRTYPALAFLWLHEGQSFLEHEPAADGVYRKLLIRTTSLVSLPLATTIASRRATMKSCRCARIEIGDLDAGLHPPAAAPRHWTAPLRVSRNCNPLPSGDQCGELAPLGDGNVAHPGTTLRRNYDELPSGTGLPSWIPYAMNLPSGEMRGFPPPPGALAISVGLPPSTGMRYIFVPAPVLVS